MPLRSGRNSGGRGLFPWHRSSAKAELILRSSPRCSGLSPRRALFFILGKKAREGSLDLKKHGAERGRFCELSTKCYL